MKKVLLMLLVLAIPFTSFAQKRLKSLTCARSYDTEKGVFTYDNQGRVVRIDVTWRQNKTYSINYVYTGDSKVVCNITDDDEVITYDIDGGKLKTMKTDMPSEYVAYEHVFVYEGDKVVRWDQYVTAEGYKGYDGRTSITWSGDNISEVYQVSYEGTDDEEWDKLTITPSSVSSTPLVNIFFNLTALDGTPSFEDLIGAIPLPDHIGTTPKNLPATVNHDSDEKAGDLHTYIYDTNAAGDVVKITVTQVNGNESVVYNLEWEGSSSEPAKQEVTSSEDGKTDFGKDGTIDANTDLNGNVIGKIYYNIPTSAGGFNAVDGCLEISKSTSDSDLEGKDIFGEDFKNHFTGIVFKVPAGSGKVKVTGETTGAMMLKVRFGNDEPFEMMLTSKGEAKFPYNVSQPTYVYIYGTILGASARTRAASANTLKIYGIEWGDLDTGIEAVGVADLHDDVFYNLNGQRVLTPKKGNIYIRNKKKILVK